MAANIIIPSSVVLYIIILISMYRAFSKRKFTGSDAAGNGMAKGLTFFYGLGALFLLAIILTIVNAFFFKDISFTWIKIIFFVPIVLPVLIIVIMSLEIGIPRKPSIEKQLRKLSFEIRTKEKLKNATFSLHTSSGDSEGDLNNEIMEEGFYRYRNEKFIFYENKRILYIKFDGYEAIEYELGIPYKPKNIPFTNWETIAGIKKDTQDTIKLEVRFKISKAN